MTPHEIIESRTLQMENASQSFRWLVSISLAILIAAYVAGPDLAGSPFVIITTLYVLASIGGLMLHKGFAECLAALRQEALAYQEQAATPSPVIDYIVTRHSYSAAIFRMIIGLRAVLFVATVGYLAFRAGYIG